MSKIEKYTSYAEKIAYDDIHGYDQVDRWGHPNFDCSGLVITAVEKAGIPVKTNGASYTGNIYSVFKACGFKDVSGKINTSNGGGLLRGDILLTPGHHVAIYCGGGKLVEASINEKGTITGGKSGDQTGREIWVHSYYNYPWQYILRIEEEKPKHDLEYKATENATKKDEKFCHSYKTITDATMHHGAGKTKKKLVKIPKGTIVNCYGYYDVSAFKNKFLYVETTVKCVKYVGFVYISNLERTSI